MKFVIGTRGSPLALTQVDIISALLKKKFPDAEFERTIIKTTGDKITDVPLAKIGGKGLFVKEIDEAVSREDVDFAVHSMKDVPTDLLPDIEITATPEREDVADALISRDGKTLDELPTGAVVGTSSLRRIAELKNHRPDIEVKDLRGNVDTRIRKLKEGQYDAIIMARAGLRRLGHADEITQVLPTDIFVPSVGQGSIAVVAKKGSKAQDYLNAINHSDTMVRVTAERALLKQLGGGCQVPIGTFTRVDSNLFMDAVVLSPDGREKIKVTDSGSQADAEAIGVRAGRELLKKGAAEILEEVYGEVPEYE